MVNTITHIPQNVENSQEFGEIVYPYSDGKPMGESGIHVNQILLLKSLLDLHYQKKNDVYVCADMFLYYEEGNPAKNVSPDVMVILGVPKYERKSFFTWKEGKSPDVVFEITSESSFLYDTTTKLKLYQKLGVKEYFIFNPLAEPMTLENALIGHRLEKKTDSYCTYAKTILP